jgi:hypothetical protein
MASKPVLHVEDRTAMQPQLRPVVRAVAAVACVAGLATAAIAAPQIAAQAGGQPEVPVIDVPDAPPAARSTSAIRRTGPIALDGVMREADWANAPVASEFWQRFPIEGGPPAFATEFRVVYDDAALYVGVRAHDPEPDKIKRLLTRRDEMSPSDWILVGVDSYHDRRTAFVFGLNAAGVQRDWLVYDDFREDPSWDAVWTAGAQIDDQGWSAEFRIPLSQLRFSSAPEQEWGLQVARVVGRTGEQDYWAAMPKAENRTVSKFGTLGGLTGVKPGRRLELLPYVSAGAEIGRLDDSDPFDARAEPLGNLGVDVRYGLGSAFTLAASINPDFGQVEADPSQVNLSANELFFPEKRPFFLEGVDIFQFPLAGGDDLSQTLFYTRRIGASPHGSADGDYVDQPTATTIFGAAKVSGKAGGWSIGLLEAVTAEEEARVDVGGVRSETIVEPLTNYALARVKRDFRDGDTQVGAVVTAVHRKLDGTGLDDELHDQAYTGGAELRHRFWNQAYVLNARLTGSWVHGAPAAIEDTQRQIRHLYQRPDASYVELDPDATSLAGYGLVVDFGRSGTTRHWRWAVGTDNRSPGFEANDLGFHHGADFLIGWAWAQYREDKPGKTVLAWNVNWNGFAFADYEPQVDGYGGNVNGWAQFTNHWSVNAGIAAEHPLWDIARLRGGPALRGSPTFNTWLNINSDDRKRVRAWGSTGFWRQPASDSWNAYGDLGVTIQARPNIDIFLGPSGRVVVDDTQYVDEVADTGGMPHYVFARIRQVSAGLTLRGSWTFSPRLSLQFYAQPFVAAGRYKEYREAADTYAASYEDRFHEYTAAEITIDRDAEEARVDRNLDGAPDYTFGLGDFNFRALRSNVVMRWEYKPGSTVFLIWSHGQTDVDPDGRFDLASGMRGMLTAPSEDVVMVKVNYWVGL